MQAAADAQISRKRPAPPELLQAFGARFGERFSTCQSVRDCHGRDDSPYDKTPPDCVVYPTTSEEVAEVVRMCALHRVPVIAYGAGTSIEGHIMAVEGGVTIDLSRMNKIVAVNGADLTASVEAGVTRKQLNAEIAHTGLFFPVDPGANARVPGTSYRMSSGDRVPGSGDIIQGSGVPGTSYRIIGWS
jgi:D-lactate dehydrogenase (cytochrome)